MRTGVPALVDLGHHVEYRVTVEWSRGTDTLWYRVEKRFADFLTTSSDAALLALLIPAMAAGEEILLAGEVSEQLHRSLAGPYQELLQAVIPSLHHSAIRPAGLRASGPRPSGIATGFSGGVDSFCVLADHYYGDQPSDGRVTHLLFNNVGSHGREGQTLFRDRQARAAQAAAEIGLPLIVVDSNVDAFYGPPLGFQQTHTPRNTSVPFLLQGGIGRFLYASTYAHASAFVGPAHDMAYSDMVALPLLSTGRLEAVSTGSEHTRVEKTLRVANLPVSYRALDVCARGNTAGNCSACTKCMRTLLTLEIAELVDRYARVFDLAVYREGRERHCSTVLRSTAPLNREIVAFAVTQGYAFPLRSYAASPLPALAYMARRLARRLRRHDPARPVVRETA